VAAAAGRVRIVGFFWADPDPALVEVAHRGGALACWQVGAMPMYAGESSASITALEPAAQIIETWATVAERPG
jgi:hypothetical protein